MTKSLLINAEQVFLDNNGVPLGNGTVTFYIPGTDTLKDTWQDPDGNVTNSNPVLLDSAGRAIIWGDGHYREVLKDNVGNLVWDQLTYSEQDPTPAPDSIYELVIYMESVLSDGEVFPIVNMTRNLTMPAALAGSVITNTIAPTGSAILTLYKNGISIGIITFNTNGTNTVAFPVDVSFTNGDQFSIQGPATHDATLAFIAMTLVLEVD